MGGPPAPPRGRAHPQCCGPAAGHLSGRRCPQRHRPWNWPSGRQVTARREATILDTLAAAYAETGQYAEAVATARAARDLAISRATRGWPRRFPPASSSTNTRRPF